MKSSLLKNSSFRIHILGGSLNKVQHWRQTISRLGKWEGELQELNLAVTCDERSLKLEMLSQEEVRIGRVEISIPIKKEWESLIPGSKELPWGFLGNRQRQEYLTLYGKKSKGELEINIQKGMIKIQWLCDIVIPQGKVFSPGEFLFHWGDPMQLPQDLIQGVPNTSPAHDLMLYREFPSFTYLSQMVDKLDDDLEKVKELEIPLTGYLFRTDVLGKSSEDRKHWQKVAQRLKSRKLQSFLYIPLLRLPKKHKVFRKYPQWFIKDSKGNSLMKKEAGEFWAFLDITQSEVRTYLVKKLQALQKLGFQNFFLEHLEDILLDGYRQESWSVKKRVECLYMLLSPFSENGTLLGSNRFFSCQEKPPFEIYFTGMDALPSSIELLRMMHLFPLCVKGRLLNLGPLGLNRNASQQKEALREQLYHQQLLAGGFVLLGGPTKSLTEETRDKWERISSYHESKAVTKLLLNPLGFLQRFLLLQNTSGLAGIFNLSRRKRPISIIQENRSSKKAMEIHDRTRLISPEVSIHIPGNRSQVLKF